MKKRAMEAAFILAALVIIFGAVNFLAEKLDDGTVKIDGQYYSKEERELTLILMTDDGLENLAELYRLEKLKISSYRAEVVRSAVDEVREDVKRLTDDTYPDCTFVEDISVVASLSSLGSLDVSGCAVTNISCISGLELTWLDISDTNVEDISLLADMDSIEYLSITGIPAEDYSPLLEMKGLKTVDLDPQNDTETVNILRKRIEVKYRGENIEDVEGTLKLRK